MDSNQQQAAAALRLLLLYGESLMVVLHLWILLGVSLPDHDAVRSQPPAFKYFYLLSDASQPLIVAALVWPTDRPSPAILACLAVHALLYAAFAWDDAHMEGVVGWAYAPWPARVEAPSQLPGVAACLDAVCHGWGLRSLLVRRRGKAGVAGADSERAAWMACAVGAAVGACTMAHLS